MLKIWDPTNFRRTLSDLSLNLPPIFFAIAENTYPASYGNVAAQLDIAARNHDVMLADIYLGIASAILFIPAVFALLHVTRRRGVVLGHVAAILTVAGVCLAHLALGGLQLMLWAMAGPGVDRQAMAAFIDKTMQNPAGLPLVLGHDLFALGLIVFGTAVWRSGFGYRWAGPAIAIGVVIDIAAVLKDGETGFFSSRSHQWIRDPSGTLAPSCEEPLDLGGRSAGGSHLSR